MGEIFYLDWSKQKLFGWETVKLGIRVASILAGIRAGDDFPPVPVTRGNNNILLLCHWYSKGNPDGGHHRALGHLIEGAPLKCELVDIFNSDVDRPIENCVLAYWPDDFGVLKAIREDHPAYRDVSSEAYESFIRKFPHDRKVSEGLRNT